MDNANEILNQAAAAAVALLPELQRRRQQLIDQTVDLNKKIEGLTAIVRSAPGSDVKIPQTGALTQMANAAAIEEGKRAPHGQMDSQIEGVLLELGALTAIQLHTALEQRYQMAFSRSTLYANLQRGVESGKYLQRDGKWLAASDKYKDL